MQRIKIAKMEIKEGDNDKGHWKNFILTGEDKAKISIFEPNNAGLKPSELREGDTLEGEIELKGKYANFISYKVIEHAKESEPAQTAKIPTPQREPFVSDPTRNASIEAQTAYGKIMDNWEKDIPETMKLAAARWGLSKLGVTNMPKIEDCLKDYFKEAPGKPIDKESVQPAQPEAQETATVPTPPIVAEIQGLLDAVNWKPATWRSWIKMQRWDGVDTTGTLAEVLSKCNPNQINMFANHLKELAK